MNIEAENAIKHFFPNPSLQGVFFEALVNSFDAGASKVSIVINIDSFDKPESLNIVISDNGDGFTDENFNRFKTLLKTKDNFHKGCGRLVFLHYFKAIEISSTWKNSRREFVFKKDFDNNVPIVPVIGSPPNQTSLTFRGFTKQRIRKHEYLEPEILKTKIIEHLFPTLYRFKQKDREFEITISLKTALSGFFPEEVAITLSDIPEMEKSTIPMGKLTNQHTLFDRAADIELNYHIDADSAKTYQFVAFNVDGRIIPINPIKQSALPSGYSCFLLFESKMVKFNADSSREKLILPEGVSEADLYRVLRKEVGRILAERIPQIRQNNSKTKDQFAKEFPHLQGYFGEDTVGQVDYDEALFSAQKRLFQDQKKILQSENLDDADYKKSLELSSRALTEYVLYREKIISRLQEMNTANGETDIHNLIVPRGGEFIDKTMTEDAYHNNAWLLDDKFMTFKTILSEKRMSTIIDAITLEEEHRHESGRPDIAMIFSADPDDEKAVDVVVVEIKRKTDNEKENLQAIDQLLDRAMKLADHCPNIQRIWYYAVIQVNETLPRSLRQRGWVPLFSKKHVYYREFLTPRQDKPDVLTPAFIVSYDAIVEDARSRNHTFLEILRAGMRKYAEHNKETKNSRI